ncbi:amino acid permease [Alicyclobacillus sp. SO9]|uniref:amino acid permease n=1 Tax=Alicyclobacillus sp. SO9 TaxID=2665646 RepID=UPI0018E8EEBA|nr:amino acid permease [Alicyclobacillus sp. SO9]QQE77529.1 amino acid permease [Alicyclobacillus sp. SO9]
MKKGSLGVSILTALVIGNMVGSGIFMIPATLAKDASPAGALWAWGLTGFGVLMLALVFGTLSLRKPEMTGGPQIYAKALVREGTERSKLLGYSVSWGYWVANWAGNVAIITTFTGYLTTFLPVLTDEKLLFQFGSFRITIGNLLTFVVASLLLWLVHTMILKGIEGAGRINLLATAAKVIGFVFFIVITLFVFQKSNLLPMEQQRVAHGVALGLMGQINHGAMATLWPFIGVESAMVFSSRAKRRADVKIATILGLLITIVIYISITLLVMGALPQHQLMNDTKPLVDALNAAVGPVGRYPMAALGLVSLLGATIGWILLSAEVAYQASRQGLFPRVFGRENKNGAQSTSLVITNVMAQVFLLSTLSQSIAAAFNFVIFIATLSYLFPYAVAALYQLKLTVKGETYEGEKKARIIDGSIAFLGFAYAVWVIKAGTSDLRTFLFGVALLAAGLIFYPAVRKSRPVPTNESAPQTQPSAGTIAKAPQEAEFNPIQTH